MDRRDLLSLFPIVALTGCGTRNSRFRVPGIIVTNRRPERVKVVVELVSEQSVVFSRSTELAPARYEDGELRKTDGATWRVDSSFSRPITLQYDVEGDDQVERPLGERAKECVRPTIEIERSENRSVVAYAYTCKLS